MTWTNSHIPWLNDTGIRIKTKDSKTVEIWDLAYESDNDAVMTEWAQHLRNHYCLDDEIDNLRKGTGKSRAEYLELMKFPDSHEGLGPSTRAGDFGEILLSDFLEFVLNYWVPRNSYANKNIRNESTKGCDVIGVMIKDDKASRRDTLIIFEVKAQLTRIGKDYGLQLAIDGSAKDKLRKAETLNAIKQRYFRFNQQEEAQKIERFQNPEDVPFTELFGAAALFSTGIHNEELIKLCSTADHPYSKNLKLIVIHGNDLISLVHNLYGRAASEA